MFWSLPRQVLGAGNGILQRLCSVANSKYQPHHILTCYSQSELGLRWAFQGRPFWGRNFLFFMLALVGTSHESFEKLPSREMRPESLVLPLSAGTARGNRDMGKQSLAGLSGKMSPSEDATRPSAIICNENICHEVGGMPPLWDSSSNTEKPQMTSLIRKHTKSS